MVGGGLILLLRFGAELAVERTIADNGLADAIGAAITRTTDDLKMVGLWTVGYGVIVAAAAGSTATRRRVVSDRVVAWVERRRATTGGPVLLGALIVVSGIASDGSVVLARRLVPDRTVARVSRRHGTGRADTRPGVG